MKNGVNRCGTNMEKDREGRERERERKKKRSASEHPAQLTMSFYLPCEKVLYDSPYKIHNLRTENYFDKILDGDDKSARGQREEKQRNVLFLAIFLSRIPPRQVVLLRCTPEFNNFAELCS